MKTEGKPSKSKDIKKVPGKEELKTDLPMSEKDEIKAAETKLKELQKKKR